LHFALRLCAMTKPILLLFAAATRSNPAFASSSSSFHIRSTAFAPTLRRAFLNLPGRSIANHVLRPTTITTTSLATPPGKGDFYDDEELFDLLNLHQALNPDEEKGLFGGDNPISGVDDGGDLNEASIAGGIHDWVLEALNDEKSNRPDDPADVSAIPGLHELVLEAVEDINSSSSSSSLKSEEIQSPSPTINQLAYDNLRTLLRDKKPSIRAIATDIDGTLLSGRFLHPTTEEAILNAIDLAYNNESNDDDEKSNNRHFFPATGKSRKGAVGSLGPTIGPLLSKCPGVYLQGLYCVDGNGGVLFERKLSASAVRAAEDLVADFDISVVGYDGDDLYTTERTDVVIGLSEIYGEPTVEMMNKLAGHEAGMHKLLLMDEDLEKLAAFRPRLEELARENDATVTQAIPTMLELLPSGCSKANGVRIVCETLGIDAAQELLAMGDAENDSGMLRMASIGVAVGNACPQARESADFIMKERHDEGGAGLAMNLFGF